MISVLLTLLKIFGIVLLILLGLLLLISLIVLFVPVRYRIKGYYKDDFVCYLKATWLLHLVSLTLNYEKQFISSIKILGFDLSSILNRRNASSSKSKKKEIKAGNESDSAPAHNNISSTSQQTQNEEKQEDIRSTVQSEESSYSEYHKTNQRPDSLIQKIKNCIINIKNKFFSVYYKICELFDNIKEIITNIKTKKESAERYIKLLQREEIKGAFSLCKKRFFNMIKQILPKNMKIHAHIGMEDPATTGYIVAIHGILPDKLQRQIQLQAEFDEVILEGDFMIKGACNVIRFIHEILCIVSDKNCRTFYQLVKKEISNERN